MQKLTFAVILSVFFCSCTEKKETESYRSGRKKRETCYRGDKKIMETCWYDNGQCQYIEKYNDAGLLDGERQVWDSTGNTLQKFYINQGTQDSLVTFQKQVKSMTTIDKEWKTDSSKHTMICWYKNGKIKNRRDQVNTGSSLEAKPKKSITQDWDSTGLLQYKMESYYTKGSPDSTVSLSWYKNGHLENRHTSYCDSKRAEATFGRSVSWVWDSLSLHGTKTYYAEGGRQDSIVQIR